MKSYDLTSLHARDVYKLVTGVVQPRPIAWVSTVSESGVRNLAPFSFFTIASREPMTLFLSIGPTDRPGHGVKDTLANVLATRELVVNIVSAPMLQAMVRSSAEVPDHVDEFDYAGVGAAASEEVAPPRVERALVAIECRVDEVRRLGTDTAVFARALRLHAGDDVVNAAHHVDGSVLQPVGRTAGATYCIDPVAVPSPPVPQWAPAPHDREAQNT
ncbi:flavin reductase family protein [Actinomadura algeriensis]|uniref:Flavin reductase (DIM6/NTAB) family NADH-FMN oxidoreductase RutF n=1 Tax=Actinomadura algeriensis TaxID=1679523 RepID=A0ABR9K2C0_9ACTN|nr:flavin reductase family protein [Actinomadura algeriensis]MBE1537005.1 flavin reductase (DIM6/NTAB) family NADH-FMN oxidoreductase RutF [Actinomadura algeriensis]